MKINYVIIQAGGKGTRLGKYTFNKPKALISIKGMPIILNTMSTFSGALFIIIGDYKYEVLRKYLRKYSKEKYILIHAKGKGTCSGIREALEYIPDSENFIITWCDLYFDRKFKLPEIDKNKNYIGLSNTFRCRWSYSNGVFQERASDENGVAGFFILSHKNVISDVPKNGEFVRYLSDKNIHFESIILNGVHEYGTSEEYEKLFQKMVYRPFNEIREEDGKIVKVPLNNKGKSLAELEKNWYKWVSERGFDHIPKVYKFSPLTLEKLNAVHPFELQPSGKIIESIVNSLKKLHSMDSKKSYIASCYKEYYQKTFERLYDVFYLIPHSTKKDLKINGKLVPNPYYIEDLLEDITSDIVKSCDNFRVIHGDPTFSNILIESKSEKVYFIDPRGYFGYNEIFGDPDYDYAKVYYSLKGNYDKFNRRRFMLKIFENEVELQIESNGYEKYETIFFDLIGDDKLYKIKFLHAIIWLSLTTYAWDDFDMMAGAFYNGALKLLEVLK